MENVFNHSWIFMVLVVTLNAFLSKKRVISKIETSPDLRDGYQKLFKGFLFFGYMPWLIMGVAIESGQANLLDYFRPSEMNTAVLTLFAILFISLLFGCYWIFVSGGAEFLSKHPGFIAYKAGTHKTEDVSPNLIKFQFGFLFVFGVVFFLLLWFKAFPIHQILK